MANVKTAMEYAAKIDREAITKRLSESDLEAPTLLDVVVRHEQAIKDVCLIARNAIDRITVLESKHNKKWVSLTDEEMFRCSYDADGFMIDREVAMKAVEAKLKEKNCG